MLYKDMSKQHRINLLKKLFVKKIISMKKNLIGKNI
nr:MAG TPA: hypothetical protein [Caudoviricetes sp.]